MKNTLLLFTLLFYAAFGAAQTNPFTTLSGKVVDPQGNPLAGVTIYLKSQTGGAITLLDGSFKLNVPEGDVLTFSYTGWGKEEYTLTEIELEFKNVIVLEESGIFLPECVIKAFKVPLISGDGCACGGRCYPHDTLPVTISLTVRDWTYSPNPTQDAVLVQTPESTGNILVYAMNGAAVTRVKVTEAATRVELAAYPAGTYFLYFENAGVAQAIGKVALAK